MTTDNDGDRDDCDYDLIRARGSGIYGCPQTSNYTQQWGYVNSLLVRGIWHQLRLGAEIIASSLSWCEDVCVNVIFIVLSGFPSKRFFWLVPLLGACDSIAQAKYVYLLSAVRTRSAILLSTSPRSGTLSCQAPVA